MDDELQLLSHALAALALFKQEEDSRREHFQKLFEKLEEEFAEKQVLIDAFQEDWQLSQFWYDDHTADTLARALLAGADKDTVVCVASAPSVYAAITKIPKHELPTEHIYLLEYDTRFQVMAGSKFYAYDYNEPDNIPEILRHKCHRLLIDPPFLEEQCQRKLARAARNLLAGQTGEKTALGDDKWKLISSTGERMRDVIKETYPETRLTSFLPQHKNGLSNEFRCYASFEGEYWHFDNSL